MPGQIWPDGWLHEIESIARDAGRLLLTGLQAELHVELKGAVDLVTEMDRRSEALIRQRLRDAFPDTDLLAEEGSGSIEGRSGGLWIVDPLDGTTNYAHGFPVFAVSMALEREGCLELGVVYDPTRDECFSAARGRGARLNGRPIRVTDRDDLGQSLLATGFPYDIRTSERNNLRQFGDLVRRVRAVRRAGAAAIDLSYVAAGRFDGYWEEKIAPWDVAAGALLVQEAGGRVTGYGGEPIDIRGARIVATNGHIHDQLVSNLIRLETGLSG